MFSIKKVELVNFRTFRGEHTFVFPTAPGLYSITGKNLYNPGLEAGGVGKSSLIEAIRWCSYGATSRNLKSTDLVSWGENWCSVNVHLDIAGVSTVICRKHKPNELTLEENSKGRPVEQETVTKALRIGPEAYDYSVMFPQFEDSFFDLKPEAKLKVFTEIMGLDYWLDKSRGAGELVKRLTEEIDRLESQLDYNWGELDTIKADITRLREGQNDFERAQDERTTKLEKELKGLVAERPEREKALKQVKTYLLSTEARLALMIERAKKARGAGGAIRALQAALERLEKAGPECPTCLQKVSESHRKGHQQRLHQEIEAERKRAEAADQLEQDVEAIRRDQRDFEDECRRAMQALEQSKQNEAHTKKRIAETKAEQNPTDKMLKDKQQQLGKLKDQIERLKHEVDSLTADRTAVEYWVTGFKRIRLMLIEEALSKLEIEVNNNLASLGLVDWQVKFDVERENKSGGITKGFSVLVQSAEHNKPVRYEAWCGNETQRLRLAGNLGLANLIMERAGLSNTIEFFDEPSQHMGAGGLTDLCDTLAERAEADGKRIFLVDHHSLDYPFKGVINITRDGAGSHIE